MTITVDTTNELAGALLEAACKSGVAAQSVDGLQRLSGGASKETLAFDLTLTDGSRIPLVLRRQPPGRRFASQGLESVAKEASIVRLAHRQGVPVPEVAFELPPGSAGGDGYVMEHIDGETVGVRVLKLPELELARAGMARQCGEILARLHGTRDAARLGLTEHGALDALAALESRYRMTKRERPVFELAFRWLKENLPTEQNRVLLHGDFRNGNLVVGPEGIRAVLDWELAIVGPPAYDLAWLCVASWRFQKPHLPVGGFGTREDLMAGYVSAGAPAIEASELHAWEVFQTLNWGIMCAGAGQSFLDGNRSVEGSVIARRASETEFDLLRLLEPDHPAWMEVRDAG